jgi:hypothetical protein
MFDQFIAEQCQQGVAIEALVAARSHVTSAYWLSSSPTNQMRSLGNSPVLSP